MAERRSKERRAAPKRVTLGPGVHSAFVELAGPRVVRVRTSSGERANAEVADGVERALVDECARRNTRVLVEDGPRGLVIVGAIQARLVPEVDARGRFEISAKAIALRADDVEIEAGDALLALKKAGLVQMRGDKATLDFSALVRVLSARVELP